MAYRRGRSRGFRKTFRRSGRRSMRRFRRGGGNYMLKYGAGVALGYLAPRISPMQDLIITAVAVAPVKVPYGIKGIAQGYVMGMIVKNFLPSIGGLSGSTDTFTV
jgi:hypothetical protein